MRKKNLKNKSAKIKMINKKSKIEKYKPTFQMVSFCIRGDSLNPDRVTKILGIEPDKSYKKNDFILKMNGEKFKDKRTGKYKKRTTGIWVLEPKNRKCSYRKMISDLIKRLLPIKDKLKKINAKYEKHLTVSVEPHYDIASTCIRVPIKLIKTLSALEIEMALWIDMPHQMKKYHDMERKLYKNSRG
jgi:hypothetical protein